MKLRPQHLVFLVLAGACTGEGTGPSFDAAVPAFAGHNSGAAAAVFAWNNTATEVVALANVPAPLPPMPESLIYAMVNGAVHDVLNAVSRRYQPYAYHGSASAGASIEAAVATAAHDILAAVASGFANPEPGALVDQAYEEAMNAIPDGAARADGIALGHAAAGAMLASRAGDGSDAPPLDLLTSPGTPGAYRPTPPFAFDPEHLTGLAAAVTWGSVRPFVIPSGAQFRSPPPYGAPTLEQAVATDAYARDFQEVKRLGGVVSERTPEQSDVAFFWMENSPLGWNRVARILARQRRLDAWESARLFALLQFAEADAYIGSLETKYHYRLWRPVTAIRFADQDGNPATSADPDWDVASAMFGIPTPPVPDYNSAHAMAGGAAAEVLKAVFKSQGTPFEMESSSLPGKRRRFASVDRAAEENALSRVYVGYHFRHACDAGLAAGRAVGAYVARHAAVAVK